jgi:hypothetical protein
VALSNLQLIAAAMFKDRVDRQTNNPVTRFKSIIRPEVVAECCGMLGTDDGLRFQAALAGLLLSYEPGTLGFQEVTTEVGHIAALGRAIQAGSKEQFEALGRREGPHLGLTALWHTRESGR